MTAKYPSWERDYVRAYKRRNRDRISAYKRSRYQIEKPKIQERSRKWYLKNKAKVIESMRRWRKENPERLKASRRSRYHTVIDISRAKGRATASLARKRRTPEELSRINKNLREYHAAQSTKLTDVYVREMLSKYSTVSAHEWPQELVEVKRMELLCMRLTGDKRYKEIPADVVEAVASDCCAEPVTDTAQK